MKNKKDVLVNFLISKDDKKKMEDKAKEYNFVSLSEYIRFVGLNSEIEVKSEKADGKIH